MHHNGTAAHERLEAGPVSPVITREDGWLGDDDRDQPLVLQLSPRTESSQCGSGVSGAGWSV